MKGTLLINIYRTLDGHGSSQLLAQLRSAGDLIAKESCKMEFGKQLMRQA